MTKNLTALFKETRKATEEICKPLSTEDYVVQPVVDVSPPKWHLGHTTWFFEEFILANYSSNYKRFHDEYAYVFNSYYESVGKRVLRTNRGNLSRPTVDEIYQYRHHVTQEILQLLEHNASEEILQLLEIGIHHEKQHQELLFTDIKYILGHNPLFPEYRIDYKEYKQEQEKGYVSISEGIYTIGHQGNDFCYDNELGVHQVYLSDFKISRGLVTNAEYLEFINDQGYEQILLWHSEARDWIAKNNIQAPLYWHKINDQWHHYTLSGLKEIDLKAPVTHISYFEAFAFAEWSAKRLPTEFEWEVAQKQFKWGERWEWTESAYSPYPNYNKAPGALGEYNGKFMVNQKVLRGGSIVTPNKHTRATYRNFFHPHLRWQFTGMRLVDK